MMDEEGYSRACVYMEAIDEDGDNSQEKMHQYNQFLGGEIEIGEASEPTDIIWQNRAFTSSQRNIRRVIVYLIIILMLCCSGYIIFTLSV